MSDVTSDAHLALMSHSHLETAQILLKLLTQVVKHTPDGGHITLQCVPESQRIHVCVKHDDLARGMAGSLSVESELGVGSTFTLSLPRGQSWEG